MFASITGGCLIHWLRIHGSGNTEPAQLPNADETKQARATHKEPSRAISDARTGSRPPPQHPLAQKFDLLLQPQGKLERHRFGGLLESVLVQHAESGDARQVHLVGTAWHTEERCIAEIGEALGRQGVSEVVMIGPEMSRTGAVLQRSGDELFPTIRLFKGFYDEAFASLKPPALLATFHCDLYAPPWRSTLLRMLSWGVPILSSFYNTEDQEAAFRVLSNPARFLGTEQLRSCAELARSVYPEVVAPQFAQPLPAPDEMQLLELSTDSDLEFSYHRWWAVYVAGSARAYARALSMLQQDLRDSPVSNEPAGHRPVVTSLCSELGTCGARGPSGPTYPTHVRCSLWGCQGMCG